MRNKRNTKTVGSRRRRICVMTATRAEYGLLRHLIRLIAVDRTFTLQLVVTGAHLLPTFGETWREIEDDGFEITEKIEMLLASDAPEAVAKSMGLATIGFADAFARLRPDLLVLLGDRYEILCAAQVATVMRIPIAHLHGGEATEGAIDDAIRHAVTKMSHLHFVSAEVFRRRLLQMGEAPDKVFTVGAFGLDNIAELKPRSRTDLERQLSVKLMPPVFLVTYHPVTLAHDPVRLVKGLIKALATFGEATIIISGTNPDIYGHKVAAELKGLATQHPKRVRLIPSLGQQRYLSLMGLADVVIGNSSSGLLEAPFVGTPTVNIGQRQQGRLSAPSVINCTEDPDSIRAAIKRALTPKHKALARRKQTPYGKPGAARRVHRQLRMADFRGLLHKRFNEIEAPVR